MNEERVANQVASAILGPMRRRKDGRWDFREQGRKSLEAAVASWVIDLLQAEGHSISDLWSPDYDRTRRPEIASRPELAMVLDGEPAALDVTLFTTTATSRGAARADRLREMVKAALPRTENDPSVWVVIRYRSENLSATPKSLFAEQADALVGAIRDAVTGSVVLDRYQLPSGPEWMEGAAISVAKDTIGGASVTVLGLPTRDDLMKRVDRFVADRLTSKGTQLKGWGRGILVIAHGFDEAPEDIAEGFARAGRVPWWRVYWVGPSPDHIKLVAQAASPP